MPPDPMLLDRLLNTFNATIGAGFGLLTGDVHWLFNILIVLSMTLAGLWWAFGEGDQAFVNLVKKALLIGFFAFVITNWDGLLKAISQTFVALGLKAGGSVLTIADFFTPSRVAEQGIDLATSFFDQVQILSGPISFFLNIENITILLIAGLVTIVAFGIIAIQILMAIIEFKLVTLAGFVMIPWGIFSKTAWMVERPLGYVVSSGLKLLVLALVISISSAVFAQLQPSSEPTMNEAISVMLGSLALLMLSLYAPSTAAALITGGPSLGAGAAITTAAGAAAAGLGAAHLGYRAAGMGARAASGAVQAAARIPSGGGIGEAARGAIDAGHIGRNIAQDTGRFLNNQFPAYQSRFARPSTGGGGGQQRAIGPGSTAAARAAGQFYRQFRVPGDDSGGMGASRSGAGQE